MAETAAGQAAASTGGSLGPVQSGERIDSVDVLRGFALLGILLLNILAFGLPGAAYFNPAVDGATEGADLWAYIVNWLFFEGAMRALFSMLFGAGVILLTSRAEARGGGIKVADIYFRRNLLLILMGLIDAYLLLWWGDILFLYGLAGLILFVFRNVAPRTLFALGVACIAVFVLKHIDYNFELQELRQTMQEVHTLQAAGEELTAEQNAALAHFADLQREFDPLPDQIDAEINARQGGYLENVAFVAPINVLWQSKFTYLVGIWDVLSMMFIGMALLKWGIFDASRSWRFYGALAAVGYGVGIPINWYEIHMAIGSNFAWEWTRLEYIETYQFGRAGAAAGHIALVMMLCKSGVFSWVTRPLAAVGRMALTNYLSHSVICAIIFTGVGFALFGELHRYQLYYVVAGIWLFQLVTSPIWLHYFRFGPVEWLWRSLTYGERQPMRRRTRAEMLAGQQT